MIDFLRGKLVHRETDYVVLDVNGVGYRIFVANPYASYSETEGNVTLYIHYNVREDAVLLFGFASRSEQSLFRRLLEVSGIGPRVALGVLSAGHPEAVVSAIYQENVAFLTKLPGIGRKTALRMILDLKDKLQDIALDGGQAAGSPASANSMISVIVEPGWGDAKQALIALGYSEAETDKVWPSVRDKAGEDASVDKLVKIALQELFKV